MSDLRRLPGDRRTTEEIARVLRVDHAGEYGATRIYQGQLAVGPPALALHRLSG